MKRSGYVSYQLEAVLVRDVTKLLSSHTATTTKWLHLVKPRKESEPSPQIFRLLRPWACHSMHLLPGYEERSLTFKEKLSSMRSKNVPCANFGVVLQLPRVGILGQALPLFLNIEHDREKSCCLAPPTVFLKSVSVSLQTNGSVRGINDSPLMWMLLLELIPASNLTSSGEPERKRPAMLIWMQRMRPLEKLQDIGE